MNCSIECPLDDTPKASLRGLLNEDQYSTGEAVQDRTSTEKGMTEEDRDIAEDKIPKEKGSLRRIQEREHRTERMKSLIYVV
jgi:hypothetical protein